MFHLSTDRLAGLDTMILKITTPQKVPMLIPNHTLPHDTYRIPARKLKKQKPHRETRTPLADKTASNNLAARPHHPTSSMLLRSLSTAGEANLLPQKDASSSRVPCSPDLPSFLDFSSRSFTSPEEPPRHSAASLPASVIFRVSSPPVASSRRVAVRETKDNKVFEGPQWIPAFHHPNSPYVPWSSPVRRRILPPLSLPPSPVCPSPCIRSGAVAPEPWASSTFSQAHNKSGKQRLSSSWKSFKNAIKKGVKTVVSRLGKSRAPLRTMCIGQNMRCTYDDPEEIQTNWTSDAIRSTLAKPRSSGPRRSLGSLVSSDSMALAAWLAERHASASRVIDNSPREMSVEQYELVGSWLDLRRCDRGWLCGVQDCDMHTASGSPYAARECPNGLRMAMPFDSADLLSVPHPGPEHPLCHSHLDLFPHRGGFIHCPDCHSNRFERDKSERSSARRVGLCPEKASVEDGPGGDALTWIGRYKDGGDGPLSLLLAQHHQQCPQLPSSQTTSTFQYASTPPPNSSRSSPHHIIHPQRHLPSTVPSLAQTMSRGVVPQSTGPHLCPPRRRLHLPMRRRAHNHHQVNSISPSISPTGRWAWTHGLPFDDPTQLLSLRKGAQCSATIDSGTVGDKEIKYICRKWRMSKQKEWYGFYSEASPFHFIPCRLLGQPFSV
ncbi:hypothetical protein JVT61DRAFT_5756 [Boletus reticuloceps]|uniref:Uncharacterized protein n=1 Tax=Boletus reticuloceps TaxID=495285 RepID=A0A8I3ADC7_9AGAM|nr:hypothetical protein JVT61DRAFT_5756 [Boletus reticuloceps]